jgi:hypothetical protein
MGVKYVKDFDFPASAGFRDSAVPAKARASERGMPMAAKKGVAKYARGGPTSRESTGPTSPRVTYMPNPFGKSMRVVLGPSGGGQPRVATKNQFDIFGNENPNFNRALAEAEDERRQQAIERARGGKVSKMQKYAKGGKVQKYANAGRVMVPSRPTGGPAGGRGAGAAPGSLASMRFHPNPTVAKQAFIKGQSRMPDVQSRYKDVVAYSDYNPEYDIRYDPNFEEKSKIEYARGGKVGKVMREYKAGKLHSGSKKGPVVKNQKQAVAIALSEARKAGAKIPKKAEGGMMDSYGNKTEPFRGSPKKAKMLGRQDRRAREAMERAEKYAPGKSVDMPDRRAHGGMPMRRKVMYGGGKC